MGQLFRPYNVTCIRLDNLKLLRAAIHSIQYAANS